jgi:Putative ATP-dependent DNA helicase recG C-terminal/Caspase domain
MDTPGKQLNETLTPIAGNKFALVVGVNSSTKSAYLKSLLYAERDAHTMAQVLRKPECNFSVLGPPLVGKEAHTMAVKTAVLDLIRARTDQDFLLLYFSGHAKRMRVQGNREDIYFVTHDFMEAQVEADSDIHLSMRWLWNVLHHRTKAGKVLLILDCCYAGNIVDAGPDPYQIDLRRLLEDYLGEPGPRRQQDRLRLILMATGYDSEALEKNGHGFMTGLLLPALQGEVEEVLDDDGRVDIAALFKYLKKNMKAQSPNLSVDFVGTDMACILASYPTRSIRLRRGAEKAGETVLITEVSKLTDKVSEVSKIITDPTYFERLAKAYHSQPFDHVICNNSSFADLDLALITEFLKKDRVQLQEDFRSDASHQDQLLRFGLLQGSFPTYGALLCFGQEPPRWVSGASTRCTYWQSDNRLHGWQDDREYRGNLVSQFEKSLDFLRRSLRLNRVINRDEITEQWEIPFLALREALANALMHREYANRTEFVHVEVFKDRVEISSPGDLPLSMRLELLGIENKCHPRNPQIARIFYLFVYVEKVGSGIQRMQQAMKNARLPPPKFELSETKTFTVTLYRSTEFYQPSLWNAKDATPVTALDKYLGLLAEGLRGDLKTLARLQSKGMPYKGVMEALKVFLPDDFKNPDDFLVSAVELVLNEVFGKDGWNEERKPSRSKPGKMTLWVTANK